MNFINHGKANRIALSQNVQEPFDFFPKKFSPKISNFEFRRLPNRVRLFRKMYYIANAVTGHFSLFDFFFHDGASRFEFEKIRIINLAENDAT